MSQAPFLINLIGNAKRNTGIGNDMEVFMRAWKLVSLKNKIKSEFRVVDYRDYQCKYANLNVFFENLNPVFYPYANKNVLIPNQEYFFRRWLPYLESVDEVWCKTKYGFDTMKTIHPRVKYISWTTFIHEDKVPPLENTQSKKKEFLLIAGKSENKNAEFVTKNWDPSWPALHVYYQKEIFALKEIAQDNIIYHREFVSNKQISEIQNTYWYHICASSMEGFGHYINEARERGAYVITTSGFPMKEFRCPVEIRAKKKKMKDRLGCKYVLDADDFIEKISSVIACEDSVLIEQGRIARRQFTEDRKVFHDLIHKVGTQMIRQLLRRTPPLIWRAAQREKTMILPPVSIVTVTKNRKQLFPLPIDCMNKMNYPHHRIQWIIIEDGDENVKDIVDKYCSIPSENVVYERLEGTIGEKRNRGVSLATNEYIFMMDDDDYYKPDYIRHHIGLFAEDTSPCHVCSTIGVFHLTKMYSMINTPPMSIEPEKRISEATLAFRKSFWEERAFPNISMAEGCKFLEGRMSRVLDLNWDSIFLSFLHDKSTSSRDTYKGEPNGCHFGLTDNFFEFVTNLASLHSGKRRKTDSEKK